MKNFAAERVIGTVATVVFLLSGCAQLPDIPAGFGGDIDPPVFQGAVAQNEYQIVLLFDEPVQARLAGTVITPDVRIRTTATVDVGVVIEFEEALQFGGEYWIETVVVDNRQNTSSVLVPVYGFNPRIPELIISEFTTAGTSTRPDLTELVARTAGNLGGVTLYSGIPGDYQERIVFPPMEVAENDYIVVHWRPAGIPEEINETTDKAASGGQGATAGAWDFWVLNGNGIPNSTGTLTLCATPVGPILDAVLYSTRSYDPSSELRGYGLRWQLAQAEYVVAAGHWKTANPFVTPDDAVNPERSTATRSINRRSTLDDTNSKEDWHIVPTSGSTFGSPNNDAVYTP